MVSKGARSVVAGCVVIAATALLVGCERVVGGAVRPASAPRSVPLAQLLIDPDQFSARYPAVILDPAAVDQAIRTIDGVGAGATVAPQDCAPPPPGASPRDAVAAQGGDADTSSTLTVTLTRADTALSARRNQVARCSSFTATARDATSDVTATVLAAPPVDADDSYAVQMIVTDGSGGSVRQLVLAAQIADVRVTASWLSTDPNATPDSQTLDDVFTAAVLELRHDGQP